MSERYIGTQHFRNINAINYFVTYLARSFGHSGGDLKEIERKYKSKVKYYIWIWKCAVVWRSSVLGIFRTRFRMQLYRNGYLKYDHSGHNLFAVEDRFHMDIEQIYEGLSVFGVALWWKISSRARVSYEARSLNS